MSLIISEQRLKENFIKIAEYFKTEPGIYYGCQEMASISDGHLQKIRSEAGRYNEDQFYEYPKNHLSMIAEYETGSDLSRDLRFMWLLTMEAAMLNSLLLQASSDDPENETECLYLDFESEIEKQSQWLMYRINMTARRAAADV